MAETDRGYLDLFRNRRFALGITSSGLAWGGYAVYEVSVLLLSYRISHSLAIAGLVLLVEFGAYSVTFIAGPTVDRARNLRTVLLFGTACRPRSRSLLGWRSRPGISLSHPPDPRCGHLARLGLHVDRRRHHGAAVGV